VRITFSRLVSIPSKPLQNQLFWKEPLTNFISQSRITSTQTQPKPSYGMIFQSAISLATQLMQITIWEKANYSHNWKLIYFFGYKCYSSTKANHCSTQCFFTPSNWNHYLLLLKRPAISSSAACCLLCSKLK